MKIIIAQIVALLAVMSTAVNAEQQQLRRNLQDFDAIATALCTACDVLDFCQSLGDFCSTQDIVDLACANCETFDVNGLCTACSVCDNIDQCDADNVVNLGCGICDANITIPEETGDLCFSELATVRTSTGNSVAMKDLQIGEQVLTQSGSYETVYAFGHYHPTKEAAFLQIFSKNTKQPLEVTPGHLVFLQDKPKPVPAQNIQVGDILQNVAGEGSKVTKIGAVERKGIYAPLTTGGTVVVDGVTASSYVGLGEKLHIADHELIHLTLSPYRMLCNGVSSTFCDTRFYMKDSSMPFYVYYGLELLHFLLNSNVVIKTAGLSIIVLLTAACEVLEDLFGSSLAPLVVFLAGAAYATLSGEKKQSKTKSL